jgi:hypothetical protein
VIVLHIHHHSPPFTPWSIRFYLPFLFGRDSLDMLYNIASSFRLDSLPIALLVSSLVVAIYVYTMCLVATSDMTDIQRRMGAFVTYSYIG